MINKNTILRWIKTSLTISAFMVFIIVVETHSAVFRNGRNLLLRYTYDLHPNQASAVQYLPVPPPLSLEVRKLIDKYEPGTHELFAGSRFPGSFSAEFDGERTEVPVNFNYNISHTGNASVDKTIVMELLRLITKPTYPCKKLLKQGGRTCQRISDGDKKFCMDEVVAPDLRSCIVYAAGIGHDFSFDFAMGDLGCDVFAFDHDEVHLAYDSSQSKRVHVGHVRVGTSVMFRTEINTVTHKNFTYFYRPLDNIMYILYHEKSNIDLLKIDIEGAEWSVLEKSLFQTDILERTRQFAMEVHMEELLNSTLSSEKLTDILQKYIRILKELKRHGFELVYYEPNFISSISITKIGGIAIPVFAEQLWINRNLKFGVKPKYPRPLTQLVERLDSES